MKTETPTNRIAAEKVFEISGIIDSFKETAIDRRVVIKEIDFVDSKVGSLILPQHMGKNSIQSAVIIRVEPGMTAGKKELKPGMVIRYHEGSSLAILSGSTALQSIHTVDIVTVITDDYKSIIEKMSLQKMQKPVRVAVKKKKKK